jgi:hypothetical protein
MACLHNTSRAPAAPAASRTREAVRVAASQRCSLRDSLRPALRKAPITRQVAPVAGGSGRASRERPTYTMVQVSGLYMAAGCRLGAAKVGAGPDAARR